MRIDATKTGHRILIVDGDSAYAERLRKALAARNYRVAAAMPKDALAALGHLGDGLVICDVEGEGANLPAAIVKAHPELTCVAMARRANLRRSANPVSDDAIAFIDKTKSIDAAVAAVERCFKKREALARRHADANPAAEAANNAKLEFLAKISHELRTPLNAIIGFSELIMSDVPSKIGKEQKRSYIEDIHYSGRHLLDIINDILDFAKAEAGKLVLQESEVDVKSVAASVKRMIGPRARDARIELNTTLPQDLPNLWCDERKLKQMLLNLVNNAVKFTPPDGRIDLEAKVGPEGFVLGVHDTGIGIAGDDLPRVLQPFTQVDSTWTRTQEGTGLGLPLVKAMVELHGGSLALESELAKGTTVKLIFPAERLVTPRNGDEFEAEMEKRRLRRSLKQ